MAELVPAFLGPQSDHLAAVERKCGQEGPLQKVHHSVANRHNIHKPDKQDIFLSFVNAVAPSDQNQDRDGRMGLQFVETGFTLHVIERECRTFDWTSAPCTLHQFELWHGAQHDT